MQDPEEPTPLEKQASLFEAPPAGTTLQADAAALPAAAPEEAEAPSAEELKVRCQGRQGGCGTVGEGLLGKAEVRLRESVP